MVGQVLTLPAPEARPPLPPGQWLALLLKLSSIFHSSFPTSNLPPLPSSVQVLGTSGEVTPDLDPSRRPSPHPGHLERAVSPAIGDRLSPGGRSAASNSRSRPEAVRSGREEREGMGQRGLLAVYKFFKTLQMESSERPRHDCKRSLGQNNGSGGKCRKWCGKTPINLSSPLQRPLALKGSRAFSAIVPVYNFFPLGPYILNESPPHARNHKGKGRSQIRDLPLGGLSPALPPAH